MPYTFPFAAELQSAASPIFTADTTEGTMSGRIKPALTKTQARALRKRSQQPEGESSRLLGGLFVELCRLRKVKKRGPVPDPVPTVQSGTRPD